MKRIMIKFVEFVRRPNILMNFGLGVLLVTFGIMANV
jgi:hypothetical protein